MEDMKARHAQLINQSNSIRKNQTATKQNNVQKPNTSFEQVLNRIQDSKEIKFSKHAIERLKERGIDVASLDIEKLEKAFDLADKKGVKDALILLDEKAFVASIKNKTIITATTESGLKDNVFTNIDGAVIL